jgi:hypothetical protein
MKTLRELMPLLQHEPTRAANLHNMAVLRQHGSEKDAKAVAAWIYHRSAKAQRDALEKSVGM